MTVTLVFSYRTIKYGIEYRENMMIAQYKDRIEEVIADRDRISLALAEGVRDALKSHKQAGNPIVVMQDGKVVWLKPEEIQV